MPIEIYELRIERLGPADLSAIDKYYLLPEGNQNKVYTPGKDGKLEDVTESFNIGRTLLRDPKSNARVCYMPLIGTEKDQVLEMITQLQLEQREAEREAEAAATDQDPY